jgi:hypothetical protein
VKLSTSEIARRIAEHRGFNVGTVRKDLKTLGLK